MDHFDHEHDHEHCHEHPHTHSHSHEVPENATAEERNIAVLQYMLDHNIHHAGELNDLSAMFEGEVRHQLLHAVEAFDQANGYLATALELLHK